MSTLVQNISNIGIVDSDSNEVKLQKNFLIYLAIFMSLGGLVWGSISMFYGLKVAASVPYSYMVISFINISLFSSHKNFRLARGIQVLISLLLPFIFQGLLGGFSSSGAIMLWAMLALVGSLTFRDYAQSILWLVLFIGLTIASAFFESQFQEMKPSILPDYSLLFMVINIVMISSAVFGLMVFFVNRQKSAQHELSNSFEALRKKEEQIRTSAENQLEDAEKLYHAQSVLEEQNKRLEESENELRSITKKQLSINERLLTSQDELKVQEVKFRTVVENAPLVIYTIDKNGVFTLSEGGILHKIGFRPGQLVGTNALTMYREYPNVFKALRAALGGESKTLISEVKDIVFENHYIPIRSNKGEVTGVLCIANDITEKQKAEKELEKALSRAKRSEESLRSIAEEQLEASERLIAAEQQLQEALADEKSSKSRLQETQSQLVNNEKMASLGQLTAGIAHEINNPINFVYNGIDTLKLTLDELLFVVDKIQSQSQQDDSDKFLSEFRELSEEYDLDELTTDAQELVTEIRTGAVRTMEIVKGLRVFSRLDEEEQKPANVNENLDATLILLRNRIKNKVEVKKYYDESMTDIKCYPGQLNQVFMNLLSNAIQAIPEEETGKVSIYTENRENEVLIRIKDSGVGMSEDVMKRVFEPFFTTKPVGVGTGLGLSISYGIIEKHEGQIYVQSEEGKGTEFVIHLPKVN